MLWFAIIFVLPLKSLILVVLSPTLTTSPVKPSTSIVSPISYWSSPIIAAPAIRSFAKSWNAKPMIAAVMPKPARIDLIFTPNTVSIASTTNIIITYLIIFRRSTFNVFALFA